MYIYMILNDKLIKYSCWLLLIKLVFKIFFKFVCYVSSPCACPFLEQSNSSLIKKKVLFVSSLFCLLLYITIQQRRTTQSFTDRCPLGNHNHLHTCHQSLHWFSKQNNIDQYTLAMFGCHYWMYHQHILYLVATASYGLGNSRRTKPTKLL